MLLRTMRNGFLSAIFLGLLVLGAVGLIFSDWHGMFQGGYSKTDVAKVDGTPIKIAEFNSRVNRTLRQQNIPEAAAYQMGLIRNLLEGEVYELLIKKDASKLGIRLEDRIIAEQIKGLIAPLKTSGVSDRDALKKFLEMQGMSEKQLVGALRDELTSKILKSTVASADYVPTALVSDLMAYKAIAKNIEVVFRPNNAMSIKSAPTDKDLEAFYNDRSANYMNPETRDMTVAVLDTSKLPKPTISDADLKAAFEDDKDSYAIPASADVEQSLFDDEAKAKAVADAVKSGKSMSDAVKDATGDTKAFQGKNNFAKDGLPADIANPVFAGKSGDVIGPIKSALGYHVIQLIALKEPQSASFETVKDKIRKELEAEKASNSVYEVTSEIEDRLANGETYESLAKEYPLTITSIKSLLKDTKDAKGGNFGDKEFQAILTKAYSLKDSSPSELSDIGAAKLYSVRVDKINPAKAKPFAEVKASILKEWMDSTKSQANLLEAQKQVDDLVAGKLKFETLHPTTVKSVTHAGNDGLAKDVTERFMSADNGKFIMAISKDKDGIYIGRVTDASLPKNVAVDDKSRDSIQTEAADASYMSYMQSLQAKYHVTINDDLLARTYGKAASDTQ